ncbi:MAG: Ig-like domain-containing protein [Bacteroidetes bacterium]|nr:Ig-like domain-containing protein [Bacteroidota bacterium]
MNVLKKITVSNIRLFAVVVALALASCGKNEITVENVKLNQTAGTIMVDAGFQLIPTITPNDVKNKNVTWKSSNPAVATVSSGGYVEGVSEGNCIITVTTSDGGKTANCTVTVIPAAGKTRAQVQAAFEAQGYTTTISQDIASMFMPAYLFEKDDEIIEVIFFTDAATAAVVKTQYDEVAQQNGFTCKQDGRILYYGTPAAVQIFEGIK